MIDGNKTLNEIKKVLHPKNPHRVKYNFSILSEINPSLKKFVFVNEYKNESIDFSNPEAVKALNQAILKKEYKVDIWDIPEGFLCPAIPGRADYIHYLADLLIGNNKETIKGKKVKVLDIGSGANCIYPIIGHRTFGWSFLACETNEEALKHARLIINTNQLDTAIKFRHQPDATHIFNDIIRPKDRIDLTMCNPPFHNSLAEAKKVNEEKWKKLGVDKPESALLNFGGQEQELAYPGGELGFIKKMIEESQSYSDQVLWFTSLVSKKTNVDPIKKILDKSNAVEVKVVDMAQGQKLSRFVAWTFLDQATQDKWIDEKHN